MLNNPNIARRGAMSLPQTGIAQALVSQATPGAGAMMAGLQPVPPQVINPYKVRAHMSATQNLVGTGEPATICNLDTIDYDTASGFNATTHQYKIPVSGYWFIAAKVNLNVSVTTWKWLVWVARVYRNGNRLSEGVTVSVGDFTGTVGFVNNAGYDAMVADLALLAAGDLVDLRAAMVNSLSGAATM